MSEETTDPRLIDLLSANTKSARRNLLISCVVGVSVAKVGLIPTKISALGIEFSNINKANFSYLVMSACAYFLATFIGYAAIDFVKRNSFIKIKLLAYGIKASVHGLGAGTNRLHALAAKIFIFIDYIAPTIIASFTIYWLYVAAKAI